MDKLALISRDLSLAPPGAKQSMFIDRVSTIGELPGFDPEIVGRKMWEIVWAHELSEENVADAIGRAVARIEAAGPRGNGHDGDPGWSPNEYGTSTTTTTQASDRDIKTVNFLTLLEEQVTEEPDYIEPNFAGPGQFILIAGPPKAQKSLLLQEMLVSCAIGVPFLLNNFTVARPLRVFWLQAEMNRKLLRRRAHEFDDLTPAERELAGRNLVISERFRMLLGDDGVKKVIEIIRKDFPDASQPPDIIGIDSLANVFDGDNENDNSQLLRFLTVRLEAVRQAINPNAVIALVHHSAKRSTEELARDPFSAIRGAGALRGYYDSAIVIFRPSEDSKARKIHFELRGGEAPEPMNAIFSKGRFRDVAQVAAAIDKTMARKMLADLKAAWDKSEPWSPNRQARRDGRYATYNLAKAYDVKPAEVTALLDEWARLHIITSRERVTRKHPAGFEVTGILD
jgi:AAA domain